MSLGDFRTIGNITLKPNTWHNHTSMGDIYFGADTLSDYGINTLVLLSAGLLRLLWLSSITVFDQ